MSDIKSKEEKAKEVYLKMTSYAPYSEMNGISRDWFEKCIGNGLDEYAKQQSINAFIAAREAIIKDKELQYRYSTPQDYINSLT